jgi:hypothetical protein
MKNRRAGPAIGREDAHPRQGAADRRQHRQAAGAAAALETMPTALLARPPV